MLSFSAGLTATTDTANNGPLKRRNNFRRFPPAESSIEGPAQSSGGHRPYRGRRNDRPRQNRNGEDRAQQNEHDAPRPDEHVARNHLNDSQNQRTLPENQTPVPGARTRNESQRRGSGRGFRRGNRTPQTPRDPTVIPDSTTTHNGETVHSKQHYRNRGSRNWPRIPRESTEQRSDQCDTQAGTNDVRAPRHPATSANIAGEPRASSANRGRPYRYFSGRGRNRNFGNRRGEHCDAQVVTGTTQTDQAVIDKQCTQDSPSTTGGVLSTELPQKLFSPEEIAQLRTREIQQFKTRFPKSVSQPEDTYLFTFSPTDPDWVFDVRSIQLKVSETVIDRLRGNIPGLEVWKSLIQLPPRFFDTRS